MKIGIIRTSSIGDVVLASACLDYLKQVAPEAEVVWIGRQPSLQLITRSWPRVKGLDWPSNAAVAIGRHVFEQLSQCDVVVDLQTNHRSRRVTRHLRKKGIRVFSADKLNWPRMRLVLSGWLRGRVLRLPESRLKPEKQQYRMMLDALRGALQSLGYDDSAAFERSRPALNVDSLRGTAVSWDRETDFGSWLAVGAGASYPTKRAPTEVLVDVLTDLSKNWPENQPFPGLLLVGGTEDRAASVTLTDSVRWAGPVINLTGKLSLDETMLALSKASVLLSNDSGLAHIAEAVGRPVAVLFGPTIESFGFTPQGAASKAFSASLGCRPCSKHGKLSCRYGDQLCFRSIDTRSVSSYLAGVLRSGGAQ